MNIPNFVNIRVVDKDGYLTDEWKQIFTQLFTELQAKASEEGIIVPQQPTTSITKLSTQKSVGAIVFDSTTNQFKGCINTAGPSGLFKIFNMT